MKKISIFLALAATVLGFSSCSEDHEPVYKAPTNFVLNEPVLQNQYIELAEGNTLSLVCSQPDYGYSAVANYSAQVSLNADFDEFKTIDNIDGHQARMTFKQEDVAVAICELLGLADEDSYKAMFPEGMTYMPVYFRAVCQLSGVESSLIYSNVVSYNYIKPYFAIATPGYIYLVGSPNNWPTPSESSAASLADWRLWEPDNGIGSKVYSGTFDLPAAPMFRFYTALTGWDNDSYGSQVDDKPVQYPEFTGEGEWDGKIVKGKGSFEFPNFAGGKVTIVVDLSNENEMKVKLVMGEYTPVVASYIYMVGNQANWATPNEASQEIYDQWRLADVTGSGIYEATFDFTDSTLDEMYCRFYAALTGWGAAQYAANPNDGDNTPVELGMPYTTVTGEGCFVVPVAGLKIRVILDTNVPNVIFDIVD